jgi:type IV pilus assembly protein PilA
MEFTMRKGQIHTRTRGGFTIMELMLVVGIIGVIASIAIPNFISYQARSRRSEAFTNLSGLARAQLAYAAERNAVHDSNSTWPDPGMYGGLSTAKMPWDGDAKTHFAVLGWEPEGQVHYSYGAFTSATALGGTDCNTCPTCFTGAAYGDVDSNGSVQAVLYVHPLTVANVPTAWCNEGLFGYGPSFDSDGNPLFDTVVARSNSDF